MKTRLIFTAAVIVMSTQMLGCAAIGKQWKSLISGGQTSEPQPKSRAVGATFNQQNNLMPPNHRKYKRTTRKVLEDDSHLEGRSGSLWIMEGQGAYLFSQNIVRMIGDPIAVTIEGDPKEQLSTKAKVINKLLTALEDRRRRAAGRGPAGEDKKEGAAKPAEGAPAPGAAAAGAPAAPGTPPAAAAAAAEKPAGEETNEKEFSVKTVPTRVVERLVDGNYRVRGTQPFMIGPREYKVIVSGIIRAEDFNEQGISASQLIDSSFDIVSSKYSENRQ